MPIFTLIWSRTTNPDHGLWRYVAYVRADRPIVPEPDPDLPPWEFSPLERAILATARCHLPAGRAGRLTYATPTIRCVGRRALVKQLAYLDV